MRKCSTILSVLFILLPAAAIAQSIKLIDATQMRWSGGIAGRSGVNYTFTIAFAGSAAPVLSTLWIGDKYIDIHTADNDPQRNTTTTHAKGRTIYKINATTTRDEYAERQVGLTGKQANKPPPPVKLKGIALLVYTTNGKVQYYHIPRILHTLPPQNYP